MFIIELTFTKPLEIVKEYDSAHQDYLDRYYASGHFVVSGPQNPKVGGMIVAKANDQADIKTIVEEDPFVVNDVVDYRIVEFEPTKKQAWFNATL